MDKIAEFNQLFVDGMYKKYLKKRFGIYSPGRDITIIESGNKILYDMQSYMDISSSYENTYRWDCRTIYQDICKPCDLKYCPPRSTGSTGQDNSTSTLPSIPPIEVIVGTSEAVAAKVIAGTNFIKNIVYKGRYVEVFRNNINLPSIDPNNGDEYFTKVITSDTIILRSSLIDGELIKIKVL